MNFIKKRIGKFIQWIKDELNKASDIQNRIDEQKREQEMKHKIQFHGHY